MTKKVAYITGTRADYGLMENTLDEIHEHPGLELEVIATGMHLMEEFGETVKEVKKSGFSVHELNATYRDDDKASMARFTGEFLMKLVSKLSEINPDIILVMGDRAEMLAGAVAGAYLGIAVAHAHGGEVSSTIDELTRHAITKLSHIHLAATEASAERITKMGEDKWRIHIVGAPGLDELSNRAFRSKDEVCREFDLDKDTPIAVLLQHPVSAEAEDSAKQIRNSLEALKTLELQSVVIYPNADAGGRKMIEVIKQYQESPLFHMYPSLSRGKYLGLINAADVLVGNSSSGIIEAPSLHLPVVNVGSRQDGRERGKNVIDTSYDKGDIIKCIKKGMSSDFREGLNGDSPYHNGNTSKKIAEILAGAELNKRMIQKKLTY